MWQQIKDIVSQLGGWITIISFLGSVVTWLYYNNLRTYLIVNRILRFRKEVSFEVSMTYQVEMDVNFYDMIEKSLWEIFSREKIKKENDTINNKMFNTPPFFVKVLQDKDINAIESYQEFFVEIPKINVTYSRVEKTLDVINDIDEKVIDKMNIKERKYFVKIYFEKKKQNPFANLLFRLFGEDNIVFFRCKLNCAAISKEQEGKYVDISESSISLTQSSFNEIRKITPHLLLIKR